MATADPGTTLYDLLNEQDCGITTTPGRVDELASGIAALAEDARRRERLGRNARRYAELHLDKDGILSGFERGLQELVKQRT